MREKKLLPLRLVTGAAFMVYCFVLVKNGLPSMIACVSALGMLAVMIAVLTDKPLLLAAGAGLRLAALVWSAVNLYHAVEGNAASLIISSYLPLFLVWAAILLGALNRKWLKFAGIVAALISAGLLLRRITGVNFSASTLLQYGCQILLGCLLVCDGSFDDSKPDDETKEPTAAAVSAAAAAAVCAGLSDDEKEKQLAQLKSFLDSGLISKEEYEQRKKALK